MRRLSLLLTLALVPLVLIGAALAAGRSLYLPLTLRGGSASATTPTTAPSATATPAPSATALPTSTPLPGDKLNLAMTTATYLGGAGTDSLSAVDVAPDGTAVFGGTLPGYTPGILTPTTLLGGTDGVVLRLAGTSVSSLTRIGKQINDLEVGDDGTIAVCGDFGVAALSRAASSVVWSAAPSASRRCAIGSDGSVAALVGGAVFVYDAAGALLGTWSVGGTAQNDLAVDGANKQVLVTGYTQVSGNLQVAFIRAYGYNGTPRWKSYDFADAPGLAADTRGERLAIGRDGALYFAASINGGTGASIFTRDPLDFAVAASAKTVATDSYNTATNTGAIKMVWFGRYSLADGALTRGTSLLTRNNGKGNSISVKAISADTQGRVYLAGDAAFTLPNRERLTVAGVPVGDYELGEPYMAVLSADLTQRLVWTSFAGPAPSKGGGSPAVGVAVRGGVAALAGTFNAAAGRALITVSAVQPAPGGASDGYAVVFPAP